jgi:hypothetical protein
LSASTGQGGRVQRMLDEFNVSWLKYWGIYVELQNQLYETARAAREVSWLAATDDAKLSQINRTQRDLYATMPRRLDYMPLGNVSRDLDSASSKLGELETALNAGKARCASLVTAIDLLLAQIGRTRQELQAATASNTSP